MASQMIHMEVAYRLMDSLDIKEAKAELSGTNMLWAKQSLQRG